MRPHFLLSKKNSLRGNYMRKYGSFHIMAIFYFINWIVAAETIEGGKLFKGGNYSRKYGTYLNGFYLILNILQVTHNDKDTWTLVIKNVRQKDGGEYMCQVNSVPMVSQVIWKRFHQGFFNRLAHIHNSQHNQIFFDHFQTYTAM